MSWQYHKTIDRNQQVSHEQFSKVSPILSFKIPDYGIDTTKNFKKKFRDHLYIAVKVSRQCFIGNCSIMEKHIYFAITVLERAEHRSFLHKTEEIADRYEKSGKYSWRGNSTSQNMHISWKNAFSRRKQVKMLHRPSDSYSWPRISFLRIQGCKVQIKKKKNLKGGKASKNIRAAQKPCWVNFHRLETGLYVLNENWQIIC